VANDTKDALIAEVFCAARQAEAPGRCNREPIPGNRHRLRAFLKIQDGCDQHCTYCVTRLARGRSRSLPESEVLAHAREALAGGAQEIVLTGVALSAYGSDRGANQGLASLIRRLLSETAAPRLRLSSLEPWAVSPPLLDALDHPAVCRHLHLPLQSGARQTLRRMGRPGLPQAYARSVALARSRLPGVRITTDLLVGFPGETETEFGESLAFIEELGFADAHIFRYSPRPGTPAAGFAESVPAHLARQRAERVRQGVARSRHADEASRQGQEEEVLWIRATAADGGIACFQGIARCGIRVQTTSARDLTNTRTAVRLGGPTAGGLYGFVLPTESSDGRVSAGAEHAD
jgi:threonylcarbamoyladenosine tRNA methylthiotransferase MtaB